MEINEARKILVLVSRIFQGYICIKNRGFWEVLEQIRALYANKDRHLLFALLLDSYIQKKRISDDSLQKII